MKKYLLLIVLLTASTISILAQSISVSAPSSVSAGENFRIEYTVNTDEVENFRLGKIPGGLELIAGPSTSQRHSIQMINGHTNSSSSITYTYIVYAAKNGSYTITPASCRAAGKAIHSRAVSIKVSGKAAKQNGAPQMHNNDSDEPQMRAAGSKITSKDLFIKVSANKTRVYEQEPILLTYKVYTRVNLTQLNGKMPDLTGFHSQEIKLPLQKSMHLEKVNGQNYQCVTWSQYVMFPQMTGKLKIPSITFKGIVVQQNRAVDPFEAFFNGGSGYIEVKHDVLAPGLMVQVDPLPQRPANFSGGVGQFNISASINHNTVKAGDPISLRVVVSGTGNLKLIKQPEIKLPKDIEKYDPKLTDKTKITARGVEGSMIYDYLIVPRNQGNYTIPDIEFTYYDTSLKTYKTIKAKGFSISVSKGDGKSGNVNRYEQKENDIRGIKQGVPNLRQRNETFFGSTAYYLWFICPLVVFAIVLAIFRKRAIDNADIVRMKAGKANKVASKRLKKANKLMFEGKRNEFYDETLRALWGYVSDKLNMPVESLSKENIHEKLSLRNVNQATIDAFINAIDECEYERYAPGDEQGNMSKTFNTAMNAIEDIEKDLKQNKKARKAARQIIIAAIMMIAPTAATAATMTNADRAYTQGDYQLAIQDYNELLKQGVSAEVYYNLGNAYFRTGNTTQAILAYERAHLLSPGDADIKFNLQFAKSKTIDKITPESEMFFVTWYKALVNFTSIDNWATTAVCSFVLMLALFMLYLLSSRLFIRKVSFFLSVVLLATTCLSFFFAHQQQRLLNNRTGAIVTSPMVSVKKTPANDANEEFIIHEGTRVDITDRTIKAWRAVRLEDGREGWILASTITEI